MPCVNGRTRKKNDHLCPENFRAGRFCWAGDPGSISIIPKRMSPFLFIEPAINTMLEGRYSCHKARCSRCNNCYKCPCQWPPIVRKNNSRRYGPFYAEESDSEGQSQGIIPGQNDSPYCSIISSVSNLHNLLGISVNVGRGMTSLKVRNYDRRHWNQWLSWPKRSINYRKRNNHRLRNLWCPISCS